PPPRRGLARLAAWLPAGPPAPLRQAGLALGLAAAAVVAAVAGGVAAGAAGWWAADAPRGPGAARGVRGGGSDAAGGAWDAGARAVLAVAPGPGPSNREAAVSPSALLLRDHAVAWRELAREWRADLPAQGDPCAGVAAEQLRCFTLPGASLGLIRQLGRPGIVTLDAATGRPAYALLVGLTDDSATLRAGGVEQTVTLRALATRWQGGWSTLWRGPPGYSGRAADLDEGPVVTWASSQLARGEPGGRAEAVVTQERALRGRLRTFQVAQGLPATGRLDPLTFMQLNRAAGIDEPRLRTQP
ncbi:peptidoglycan-binding protein, partial [Ramlibacter sp. MAHUQ-53]